MKWSLAAERKFRLGKLLADLGSHCCQYPFYEILVYYKFTFVMNLSVLGNKLRQAELTEGGWV